MVSDSHNPNFVESAIPSGSDAEQATGGNTEPQELQLARLNDYLFESLANEDALAANLGSINTSLIRCSLWLGESIAAAMSSGPADVDRVKGMMQAIETQLRVTRQVDRFAQLEMKAKAARAPDDPKEQSAIQPAIKDDSIVQSEET